jgi:hypothetical protein
MKRTRRPVLQTLVDAINETRERRRLALEAAGAILIVYGLGLVSMGAAIVAAGLVLVVVANFYMGSNDAGTNDDDSQDPPLRE